jgi:hypothetical protein
MNDEHDIYIKTQNWQTVGSQAKFDLFVELVDTNDGPYSR